MPVFEYRCEECGNKFDAFFRRSQEAEERRMTCDKCGSARVRKLFSVIGLGGEENRSSGSNCAPRSK
jgi:putative FmdB family regulatory protein